MKFSAAMVAVIEEMLAIARRLEEEDSTAKTLQCPKCLSYDVRRCGYNSARKDGTRSQRILCKVCQKTSTNGAKK